VNSPQPAPRGFAAWLWRRPQRWFLLGIPAGALLAFIIGIGFTGSFFGTLHYVSTEAFCTSCHEMNTPFQEYRHGVHYSNAFGIQASCADCHVPPTFVPGLIRHIQASTEVWRHLTFKLSTPSKYEAHRLELAQKVWKELKGNDSAECRSCHTASSMEFAKQPPTAAKEHQSMAKDGTTCIDCHKGVAHMLPQGS
jgi:nitrate/TMAO reductase-like tetraheme cytochrome c subunit